MTNAQASKLKQGDYVCLRSGTKHQGRVTDSSHAKSGYLFVAWRGAKTQRVPVSWVETDPGSDWPWSETH